MHDDTFDRLEKMVARLYERAQDPTDMMVPPEWIYKTPADVPAEQKFNMDEAHSSTNTGRKKVYMHKDTLHAALRHAYEETNGDKDPFHVTAVQTFCSSGVPDIIPPMLGHSNTSSEDPQLTRKELDGICIDTPGGVRTNPSGIKVFVTTNGSMTKKKFPQYVAHLIKHLRLAKSKVRGPRGGVGLGEGGVVAVVAGSTAICPCEPRP